MSTDGVRKVNEYVIKDGRTLVMTVLSSNPQSLSGGTIYINPNTGDLQYLHVDDKYDKTWKKFTFENLFDNYSLDNNMILDNSISAVKLVDNTITADKLIDGIISTDKIANEAITTDKVLEIDASKIKNSSITTNKFIEGSIINSILADKTITNEKIADNTIIDELINDAAIKTRHLDKNIIEKANLKEKIVDHDILAANCIESDNITNYSILNNHLDNDCITNDKLADQSIFGTKIKNYAIKDIHINDMDGSKINDNSISNKKLMINSIDTNNILDNAITTNKLSKEIQNVLSNTLKLQNEIIYEDTQYLNTVLINGNMVLKDKNTKCNFNIDGDIKATGNITGAKVFNPVFADIAEAYVPNEYMVPGDPVCLCKEGDLKIERLNKDNADRFLGFVSDQYATLFGGTKEEIDSGKKVAVTLTGRIKVKLGTGFKASIGEYIIPIKSLGTMGVTEYRSTEVVGRLLENKDFNQSYVLCQLWP